MIRILYSFNKHGYEGTYWSREISAATCEHFEFIPFNHDPYLDPSRYIRAQLLDNLYFVRDRGLLSLYSDLERTIERNNVDAIVVDNCPPYHPEFLRRLSVYKALRIADGPISAYDRDFAYVHAYDHILYHSPAYSRDLGMAEKLSYVRASRFDFWPLGVFDACFDPNKAWNKLATQHRDIDVLFVGALHLDKMPFLARVKKAMGRRCRLRGLSNFKRNVYFNLKYGFPGWVRPIESTSYVPFYQRTKIGFNLHNRGDFTVGNFRLFDLPANGVMQISDGGTYLDTFFHVDKEIIRHDSAADLIDKLDYYLAHDRERETIAAAGYERTMNDHRMSTRMLQLGRIIGRGIEARALERASS